MSLDSQLRAEEREDFFGMVYKAPVEHKPMITEKKLSLGGALAYSVVGVSSLALGIPDAYDLLLQEKSYHPIQYAGTAFELIAGTLALLLVSVLYQGKNSRVVQQ
jgi:hypothetical protein